HKIERATDSVLGDVDKFLKYVSGDLTVTDKKSLPKYEHVLCYLFGHIFRHGSLRNSRLSSRYSPELLGRLDEILVDAKDNLRTPQHIVQRNPGISPLAMDIANGLGFIPNLGDLVVGVYFCRRLQRSGLHPLAARNRLPDARLTGTCAARSRTTENRNEHRW